MATETVFKGAICALLTIEILILAHAPLAPYFLWGALGLFSSVSALSFAIISELFPKEMIGRAGSALIMLHMSGAFVVQSGMGYILALWPRASAGLRPGIAYEAALAAPCALQGLAFAWFLWCGALRRQVMRAQASREPSFPLA